MLRKTVLAVACCLILAAARDALADFAAIAYSPSTRSYGYSYGQCCQAHAEQEALSHCSGSDKRIVVWVENGWCALARGNGTAYGYGWSTGSSARAKEIAISECLDRSSSASIAVCVFSGY